MKKFIYALSLKPFKYISNQFIRKCLSSNGSTIKLIFFLFFILIFIDFKILSQQDDAICLSGGKLEIDYRKKPWKGDNQFLNSYLESIRYFEDKDKIRYLVPVKFWSYRRSNGTGGASYADIKKMISELNYYNSINQTGIRYYLREIKYINRTARQVFGYYVEAPLQTVLRHTKPALNVYLVDRFKKRQESKRLVRGTYNIVTRSVLIQRDNSSTALTHEVGHYFGLLHPHRHYDQGKSKQEPVSRTRKNNDSIPLCELHGDLLSDTEAEPKLTFLVDNNCNFIGNVLKDAWGDNYQSKTNNIMSYPTHTRCRDSFTISQKAVMLYSASVNKYAKYWNTENQANQKYFFDQNEPDDYQEMAGIIEPGKEQAHNFHKIFINPRKNWSDTTDWIKFEVKSEDKRNIKVLVIPDKDNKQNMMASIYDKNQILLSSKKAKTANENMELGFENVVSDWYYIKVQTFEDNTSGKVEKYKVSVELY